MKTSVYFIYAPRNHRIKIGFSKDPKERLKQLSDGAPEPFHLLYHYEMENGPAEENRLHKEFEAHRVHGEWFAAHEDILEYIGKHSDGRADLSGVVQPEHPQVIQPCKTQYRWDGCLMDRFDYHLHVLKRSGAPPWWQKAACEVNDMLWTCRVICEQNFGAGATTPEALICVADKVFAIAEKEKQKAEADEAAYYGS